jgi:hypothetical protein
MIRITFACVTLDGREKAAVSASHTGDVPITEVMLVKNPISAFATAQL